METIIEKGETKHRSANFTPEEEQLIISLVDKHRKIVECKRSNSVSWKEKEQAWKMIEREFNSHNGKNCFRSLKTLKEKYNNIKKRTKQKWTEEKKLLLKTGGGTYKPPLENDTDIAMKSILGEQLTGLSNTYDSDSLLVTAESNSEISTVEEVIDVPQVDHDYSNQTSVLKELNTTKVDSLRDDQPNCSSATDLFSDTDWTSYTSKDLKKPVSQKLRSETNVRKIMRRNLTKKIMNPSNTLIEEKLSFVKLQKEKFLEEHSLKLELLKKKIKLIDKKLEASDY